MILDDLYNVISERKNSKTENSYTSYLFEKGLDKILKKVGEESAETIIAAKNGVKEEVVLEMSDLTYHLLVLLNELNIPLEDVKIELEKRAEKTSNLKAQKIVNKNT
ncbi:MAG: phosphoribosyl-ATP diphosphatase [Clostridia bacterium]